MDLSKSTTKTVPGGTFSCSLNTQTHTHSQTEALIIYLRTYLCTHILSAVRTSVSLLILFCFFFSFVLVRKQKEVSMTSLCVQTIMDYTKTAVPTSLRRESGALAPTACRRYVFFFIFFFFYESVNIAAPATLTITTMTSPPVSTIEQQQQQILSANLWHSETQSQCVQLTHQTHTYMKHAQSVWLPSRGIKTK